MNKLLITLGTMVRTYWEKLRVSYWFIPACMIIPALLLGSVLYLIVPLIQPNTTAPLWGWTITAQSAAQLTTTVASATITATSIAFSMTLVSLTMASKQFGPRLIQTFMDDRGTQCVLGALTSTFVFCLLAIHRLGVEETSILVASVYALTVLMFGIIDTLLLIYFIHHIATFIQADKIIERCYQSAIFHINSLFPAHKSNDDVTAISPDLIKTGPYTTVVPPTQSGYINAIDYEGLMRFPQTYVTGVEIHVRGGDYVALNDKVMTIHSLHPITQKAFASYQRHIFLGTQRSAIQDPEFSLSQLVDIALRALSPGINDPETARTSADRLTSACIHLAKKRFPPSALVHTTSNIWILRRTASFASIVDKGFCEISEAGAQHAAVMTHLLYCIDKIQHQVSSEYTVVLNKQAANMYQLALEHASDERNKRKLMAAYKTAIRLS
ncbi:DUF2254 domain-containing protein [Alteromonas sp. C1M14]|uniref:DUF2254 domain-containing protein n=1 Tax=Alteromonas sp. C1M14 TaxID=2841567 RepID=UPI001C0A232C|nr:DUF2254 domain-containing protein [Alteromonas sp. C1M14]MBU2977007.1 DUF2254 domain-containing protein [Alteromonas sp. C1M14]